MKEYRFAMNSNGEILRFQAEFQKEVYNRYLEVNGLNEEHVLWVYTGWVELEDCLTEEELPTPLPERYTGDIYEEMCEIYIDLSAIGLWACDPELCFDTMEGIVPWYSDCEGNFHDISFSRVYEVLTKLGYEVQEEKTAAETIYFIC